MFEEEMPESDSSDEDFVPTGHGSDVSEEESDNAVDEDQDTEQQNLSSKRKKSKSSKSNRKKKKKIEEDVVEEEEIKKEEVSEETPEEKKRKADALWADFLKDCDPPGKKKTETSRNSSSSNSESFKSDSKPENSKTSTSSSSNEDRLHPSEPIDKTEDAETSSTAEEEKNVEIYEFAGEKVVVEKKVDPRKRPVGRGGGFSGRGGGAAAILSQLNKKNKLSTLEKSKLDWETFKDKEGINEQLSTHNRGKNGYLEKQDFLQRADLRQFEIEKEMRAYSRSKRV